MRCSIKWFVISMVFLTATVVSAAGWPQLQSRLQQWQGLKEVVLPEGVDPLEDPLLLPLVDLLLKQGFAVLPGGAVAQNGLLLETRTTSRGRMLLLKRAADGALLALEKLETDSVHAVIPTVVAITPVFPQPVAFRPAAASSAPPIIASPLVTTASVLSVQRQAQQTPQGEMLFELDGAPLQLVVWPTANGELDLYLMYDHYVQRVRSDDHSLQLLEQFYPPVFVSRALHLDIDDLDGDGRPELAAVWAEDVRSVADGTNSLLHGWVLSVTDQGIKAVSEDLTGYIALGDGKGLLQQRLPYKAFVPEVYQLTLQQGIVNVGENPVNRNSQLLFNQIEWPDSRSALVWNDEQRLMLVARTENTRIPGSTLLTDFGRYQGPMVSVPLENPGYRSGFSATDRILEREVFLGRRLVRQADAVYTLVRGRSEGLPLVGRTGGADRLVKICNAGSRLDTGYPFASIDAFIVDFALYGEADPHAIVLLNEKADGSGGSYLRFQQSL